MPHGFGFGLMSWMILSHGLEYGPHGFGDCLMGEVICLIERNGFDNPYYSIFNILFISVVDPNTLNFDPEPEFWSNLSVSLKEKCRTNFEKNNNL